MPIIHTDDLKDFLQKSEETVKLAQMYFHENGLMLNIKKTQCMFIGTRRLLSKIPPDAHMLVTPSTSLNNMRVHFDNYLLFKAHITEISQKVYGTLIFVKRKRGHFNKNTRI